MQLVVEAGARSTNVTSEGNKVGNEDLLASQNLIWNLNSATAATLKQN